MPLIPQKNPVTGWKPVPLSTHKNRGSGGNRVIGWEPVPLLAWDLKRQRRLKPAATGIRSFISFRIKMNSGFTMASRFLASLRMTFRVRLNFGNGC